MHSCRGSGGGGRESKPNEREQQQDDNVDSRIRTGVLRMEREVEEWGQEERGG